MAPREKSLGAVVVSSLVEILARSAPRSERDPDLEATTAKLAMHPVTGTFADPALELAFAAQLFRTAYPFHAFLMALLAAYTWIALTTLPDRRVFFVTIALLTALGLLGRTLLHRMENSVGAQRIGSWTWTAIVHSSLGRRRRNRRLHNRARCLMGGRGRTLSYRTSTRHGPGFRCHERFSWHELRS